MSQWAVLVNREPVRSLARLRRMPGLSLCEQDSDLWLRGDLHDEDLAKQLAMIPGARRFDVLGEKQLRPMGRLVPEGNLPAGPWGPLATWLQIELPPAPLASTRLPSQPHLVPQPRIVRSGGNQVMAGRFGGNAASVRRAEDGGRLIGRGFARVGPVEGAGHRGVEVR